jgi:Mg2+ and Co2+ transporter CorA
MSLIALFYRVTLLDFAERTALVSRALYRNQQDGRPTAEQIRMANALRSDFLHFSNYWHFEELANKDEESQHFQMQCREYRIEPMKREIEGEIEKLNASLDNYYQFRNTEAVNRLAMLSLIFGAGAVLTGFFGMNFGGLFEKVFFQPDQVSQSAHYAAIVVVSVLAFGAFLLGIFVVVGNWSDYRDSLMPRRRREAASEASLRRVNLPDSE